MFKQIIGGGIAAALFLAGSAAGQISPLPASRAEFYGQLETLAVQEHAASLAVVVVRRGEPVFMGVWGEADRETGRRANQNTRYHLASVSKPFVAIAAMQLEERGALTLDQPVSDWLPELQPDGEGAAGMTIRHLLQHSAGLPDVEDYDWSSQTADPEAAERYLQSLSGLRLISIPGAESHYSNIGYDLLGIIISRASGQSFEAYMQENVLQPAGMRTASFLRADIDPDMEARGHIFQDGRPSPVYPYNRRHAPSSTLEASLVDMASWLSRMTLRPRSIRPLLGDDQLAAMWTDDTLDQDGQDMALGWFASPYEGRRRYSHTGGDIGFASYLAVFPDDQLGIALMTNSPMALPTQEILFTTVRGAVALYAD